MAGAESLAREYAFAAARAGGEISVIIRDSTLADEGVLLKTDRLPLPAREWWV
jgi:hypothetical protein